MPMSPPAVRHSAPKSAIHIQTGIYQHLYLAFQFPRDYFARPDASPACTFSPQGLLCPSQMHLYLAFLFRRDYFNRPDSSLACSFVPQGLFQPAKFIPAWLFCSAGIISTDRMHPITGRPSLKASLPGHSVNFRFNQFSVTSSLPSPHACPYRVRPLSYSPPCSSERMST